MDDLSKFFEGILSDLNCNYDTRSYICGIFTKYKTSQFDLSKDSITLLYCQAKEKQDFLTYQTLGDWIFFSNSFAPDHLTDASPDYYRTVAQLSYYSCYKLINKQWKCFEELADRFPYLEKQTTNLLNKNKFRL